MRIDEAVAALLRLPGDLLVQVAGHLDEGLRRGRGLPGALRGSICSVHS